MTTERSAARIYVGTYAKYNSGSIKGAWLDLEDYADKDAFLAAARALHSDEADPELMFQGWEGIPEGMVSESHIDEGVWEWLALGEDQRTIVAAYRCGADTTDAIGVILDSFQGAHDSERDWAYGYVDSTGMLEGVPEFARNYFDYTAFARDAFMGDVVGVRYEGHLYVFSNY
jgi:antirestriction protein